jgi:hypothetical protein
MSLLKLVNEIKSFSKKFKKDKSNKCHEIKSSLILISRFGYEFEIQKYLRNHLIGETDYIIPLMVLPPINNELWHNFIDYGQLINSKSLKRNTLERIIKIGKSSAISDSYKKNMLAEARVEYNQLLEREKSVKLDNDFLNKWSWILNIPKSREILKIDKNGEKINREKRLMKKDLFIYQS